MDLMFSARKIILQRLLERPEETPIEHAAASKRRARAALLTARPSRNRVRRDLRPEPMENAAAPADVDEIVVPGGLHLAAAGGIDQRGIYEQGAGRIGDERGGGVGEDLGCGGLVPGIAERAHVDVQPAAVCPASDDAVGSRLQVEDRADDQGGALRQGRR